MFEQAAVKITEILLIAHHALLRESLGRFLSAEPGFRVAAECAVIAQAMEILKQQVVDVVLLDADQGVFEARDFIHTARGWGFKGKLMVLAAELGQDDAADLIRAGVCGIFQKCQSAALLAHAIRHVALGNLWITQEQLQGAFKCAANQLPTAPNGLTKREQEVLFLVLDGLKNRDIGKQIGVSESSVKATLQKLFSKFGVRSRSQLVRIALEGRKAGRQAHR